ncbi:MAG: twin-arginine translocase TatA/TatE family subunit [Bacteroidales bacterium]|nr:twin-arginine translocase TatA/TatE family subunit [Bacteroidales bacterium]MDT8432694.1 twin-arginine translocase TatA/TatE family subunit [Bacteroidales bacterium]
MEAFVLLGMPGWSQILLVVIAILLLFGGKKIPELMRGIGQGMKEFKKATSDDDDKDKDEKTDKEKLEDARK